MTWRSWRDIAAKGAVTAPAHESGRLPAGASAAHGHSHNGAHVHEHVHGDVHAHDGGVPHTHQEEEFESELLDVDPTVYADAHEREHALDIERRFASRRVTTGQIILFGLTGGLIPCPASITVLLLCLQVGRIGLGALLVLCFSVGLALTLVLVGVAAALGMRHAASRWPGLEALAARAPYVSGAIVAAVGAYTIAVGAAALG